MLDPWIIEEIHRREEERRREEADRPRAELPLQRPHVHEGESKPAEEERGVVVIDI
jgi:hypothetical protein